MFGHGRVKLKLKFQMSNPQFKTQSQILTFEQSFKKLESLVQEFEQGNLDLEKGLVKFKEALLLAETCKKRLDEAENKIIKIKEQFKDFN